MTNEEAKTIGKAIAPKWHFRPGCLVQRQARSGGIDAARVYAVQHMAAGVWLSCHPESDPATAWHIPSDNAWPDLRDAATMGAALALWQSQPGHIFRVPCPVLTNAAAYGITDPRTIRALVDAMGDSPPQ